MSLVMTEESEYNQILPVAKGWGTKYPISDMVPPLLTKEEEPTT
jgi:uncharacterized protein YbaR (Trm112 family)